MSMSYISTSTDVSTFHWSCHCQLVFNAGCQQPGQGSGERCGEADAPAAGARASMTTVRMRTTRLMRSVSSLCDPELDGPAGSSEVAPSGNDLQQSLVRLGMLRCRLRGNP